MGRNNGGDALNEKTDDFGEVMAQMSTEGGDFGEVSTQPYFSNQKWKTNEKQIDDIVGGMGMRGASTANTWCGKMAAGKEGNQGWKMECSILT